MSDYRLNVRIRNARLLRAIEATGARSVAEFCRREQIRYTSVSALVALRWAPIGKSGSFTSTATSLMEALGALPQELWTAEQLNAELPRNTFERDVETSDIERLISEVSAKQALAVLTSDCRARDIDIMSRVAGETTTIVDLAEGMDLSRVRVKELCNRGLRDARKKAHRLGVPFEDAF